MVYIQSGEVMAIPSFSHNTIPHFRVTAATRCAYIKPLIEPAHQLKCLPSKSHIGTCPYVPCGNSALHFVEKITVIKYARQVTFIKPPVPFKNYLCFCLQFSRKNHPGNGQG